MTKLSVRLVFVILNYSGRLGSFWSQFLKAFENARLKINLARVKSSVTQLNPLIIYLLLVGSFFSKTCSKVCLTKS